MEKSDHRPTREALEAYVKQLKSQFYPWYDYASRRNYRLWLGAQLVAVISGFLTTAIAALMEVNIIDGAWFKALLIILPSLGSLAVMLQSRFLDNKALRERGRQAMQRIIFDADRKIASLLETHGDYGKLHEELVTLVSAVEENQVEGFVRSQRNQQTTVTS